MVAARDAVGLRVAAPEAGSRPHHARAPGRVQALPGDGHDRHQARGQRAVHILTGWESAGRSGAWPARVLGRLRGHGRAVAGRRRRARARDLDDRRRSRRLRDGYLGDGRRALRRLRDARLHERQGPGELPAALPDHVPERGAAGRPTAPDDADPRSIDRRERRLGGDLRAGARAVVPGEGPRTEGGGHLPAVERLVAGRGRGRRGARAGRDDRDLELRQVPGDRSGRRGVVVVAADRADAGAGPDHADRDAQRGGADRRGVHGRAGERGGRVLPVRVAPGRGPSLALVPPPPAGRRVGAVRGAGAGSRRVVGDRAAGARRAGGRRAGPRPLDRGVPVHDLPAGGPRHDAGPPGPHQLRRRSRLRAVGGAGVPARAVRPDRGGGGAARAPAVRDAGADVAPAREELRDVVPRIPADLHAARGRHHPLHQARPRVHRAGRARGGGCGRRARRGGSSRSSSSPTRTIRPTSSATSRSGTTARSSAG